jgi:hypothetical protein
MRGLWWGVSSVVHQGGSVKHEAEAACGSSGGVEVTHGTGLGAGATRGAVGGAMAMRGSGWGVGAMPRLVICFKVATTKEG